MEKLTVRYRSMVERKEISSDPAQEMLVSRFDVLLTQMANDRLATKSSPLGWLFSKQKPTQEKIRGLYIWGGVGRGKSMLMDLFFDASPQKRKRRVHFHAFMQEVHERIFAHRQALKNGETKDEDPIPPVARAIADEARLLCFDEFSVTDIADAMILARLFSKLFEAGVVVVATSNVAPDNLYKDGLNRPLFTPFIDDLKSNVEVIELVSPTDYRLAKLGGGQVYFTPLGTETDAKIEAVWQSLTGGAETKKDELKVKGRTLPVAASHGGIGRFSFSDLCEKPLGAVDYLAIAECFHTVFVEGIPKLTREKRNEAKRFIILIDTLYDGHVRLIASADAAPDALYSARSGTEAFEFERTSSRLIEMQSDTYMHASPTNGTKG